MPKILYSGEVLPWTSSAFQCGNVESAAFGRLTCQAREKRWVAEAESVMDNHIQSPMWKSCGSQDCAWWTQMPQAEWSCTETCQSDSVHLPMSCPDLSRSPSFLNNLSSLRLSTFIWCLETFRIPSSMEFRFWDFHFLLMQSRLLIRFAGFKSQAPNVQWDSWRFLCRMSFNWICLMPSWTQNQLANPGATWDDGTRTVQRSKLFVPSHRHHPDRFQVALS